MFSKKQFGLLSRRSLLLARWSTQTNATSNFALMTGAILTKQFATVKVNTLAMTTAMDSTKSTSTRWKAFGHYFAVGFVHTGAIHRKNCRCISRSLNSFTTLANAARHFLRHSSKPCSNHQPGIGDEPNAIVVSQKFGPQCQSVVQLHQ